MNDIERVSKDLANFNATISEDIMAVMERAVEGVVRDLEAMRFFGVIVGKVAVGRELRQMNRRVNMGRGKHVSIKRPSPRLSRRQVESFQAQARMNCIFKQVYNE